MSSVERIARSQSMHRAPHVEKIHSQLFLSFFKKKKENT
jgi:hypothetical protein